MLRWIAPALWALVAAHATDGLAALPGVDVFPGHTSAVDCYCGEQNPR